MSHREALRVLGLTGDCTRENIKYAYRYMSKHYHPDRNAAGLEMMKVINGAYQSLSDYVSSSINTEEEELRDSENNFEMGEELSVALNVIIHLGLEIEVCGSWIWLSGDTKPLREVLKEAGYKWAPKKLKWSYHVEDGIKRYLRGGTDMQDIRTKYGSVNVKSKTFERLSA